MINLNNGHHSPAPRVVHDALKHYLDSENQLPVYYASLILLFGAQLTQTRFALRSGARVGANRSESEEVKRLNPSAPS